MKWQFYSHRTWLMSQLNNSDLLKTFDQNINCLLDQFIIVPRAIRLQATRCNIWHEHRITHTHIWPLRSLVPSYYSPLCVKRNWVHHQANTIKLIWQTLQYLAQCARKRKTYRSVVEWFISSHITHHTLCDAH